MGKACVARSTSDLVFPRRVNEAEHRDCFIPNVHHGDVRQAVQDVFLCAGHAVQPTLNMRKKQASSGCWPHLGLDTLPDRFHGHVMGSGLRLTAGVFIQCLGDFGLKPFVVPSFLFHEHVWDQGVCGILYRQHDANWSVVFGHDDGLTLHGIQNRTKVGFGIAGRHGFMGTVSLNQIT